MTIRVFDTQHVLVPRRDLTSTFWTPLDSHALILLRPTQARNSGRAEPGR